MIGSEGEGEIEKRIKGVSDGASEIIKMAWVVK